MVGSQDLLPVYHDLHTLQITDRQAVQLCVQSCHSLRSNTVHYHFCARITREDKIQYASDLTAAASDKDMGRNRQFDQRIRRIASDDRHILKTIFCPVFRKEGQGIFFALD